MNDLRHDPTTGNVLNNMPRNDQAASPLSDVVRQAGQMMGTIPPDDPAAREQYWLDNVAKLRHRARAAEAALQEQRGRAEAAEESPRPVTVHCAPIADYDTRTAPNCTVWTEKVDERLAALEAAIALHADRIQVLMLQQDDGK